jgi:hypothetical protein
MGGGFTHVQLARHEVGGQARPVFLHQRDFSLGAGDGGVERGGFLLDVFENSFLLSNWRNRANYPTHNSRVQVWLCSTLPHFVSQALRER